MVQYNHVNFNACKYRAMNYNQFPYEIDGFIMDVNINFIQPLLSHIIFSIFCQYKELLFESKNNHHLFTEF